MQPVWFFHVLSLLLLLRLSSLADATVNLSKTITVDLQGQGDFKTVQDAVASVPDGNSEWVKIHVKQGTYREKVSIPSTKGYIFLQGEGYQTTEICWDAHAHGLDRVDADGSASSTFDSATLTVLANNFVAGNISFKNTYEVYSLNRSDQAVAALVGGDKSAFYGCAFSSFQDTLCDFTGRHYFQDCLVQGAVDFVFGYGQSIYQGCVLQSTMPAGPQPGWVTAHARKSADSPGGLVFKECTLQGTGLEYLGRAWNQYATVVFYRTTMTNIVAPLGWAAWHAGPNVSQVTFAEADCTGAVSNPSSRVAWEKHLSANELATFVTMSFIDDGWVSTQPKASWPAEIDDHRIAGP